MKKRWIPPLLALAFMSSAQAASPIAEVLCAPDTEMKERLAGRYQAQRTWNGLRGPDQIMELWEDSRGDWTLVIANSNGIWCIVAMGSALTPYSDMPQG